MLKTFLRLKIVVSDLIGDPSKLWFILSQMRFKTTIPWIADQVGDDKWRSVLLAIGLVLLPFVAHAKADIKPPLPTVLAAKAVWLDNEDIILPNMTFDAPNGLVIKSKSYTGKWLLLHYWATWCPPCVKEMPKLDSLQKTFVSTRLKVVTVSADTGGPVLIENYFKRHKLKNLTPYTAVPDQELGLPVNGIPTTFIVNPRQEVLLKIEGSVDWRVPEVQNFLAAMMGIDVPQISKKP